MSTAKCDGNDSIKNLPRIISSLADLVEEGAEDNISKEETFVSITKSKSNDNSNSDHNTIQRRKNQKRLVLHFDINETILIGDDAGGDTVEECLNKIIAKVAFVQLPKRNDKSVETKDIVPICWWDGTPIIAEGEQRCEMIPPLYTGWEWPKDTCPYYRTAYKKRAKYFTMPTEHGEIYRPLYDHLKERILNYTLKFSKSRQSETYHESSHPFNRMIPSFFHTLVKLKEEGRDYTLVLRTFGSDLEDIALALSDFANGKHPLFPNFREPKLVLTANNLFKGRWRENNMSEKSATDEHLSVSNRTSSVFDLLPWNSHSTKAIASGDDEVLHIIERSSVIGVQDDYNHWDENDNAPWAGKPVWIHNDAIPTLQHHIFFDDNIHNDTNDSIVAVRAVMNGMNWLSLTGSQTIDQQGKYLFRVPTVEALLNNLWFYEKILNAESNVTDEIIIL